MHAEAHGNFAGKRLVVFGAGYIGGELARQAVARGVRVTALTRNEAKAAALRAEGIEAVVADLADAGWHAQIAGGADFVLNAVSSGGGGVDGYRHSYLAGMKSVLAWARQRGPVGTLVYTSSTSVYPQDGGVRVDELALTTARDERAGVLVETEALLLDAMAGGGTRPSFAPMVAPGEVAPPFAARTFILRLAGIYGPARGHLLEQVRAGEVAGHGGHHLNLAHRDDICAAIWAAFGAPATVTGEVFNVADNAPATKSDAVAWLAARLGVAPSRFTGLPAGGRRAVTPDRIILNTKLKVMLGWAPRYPSFREGYAALLAR